MRTKLLSSIVLGTMALAGVASADPYYARDHRYDASITQQPNVSFQARVGSKFRWWNARPAYRSNVNYGYQLDSDGDSYVPYNYGNDPYVEGIARGEWTTLDPCFDIKGHTAERVPLAGRPLQSVELQATSGSAHMYTVGVIFRDGHQEAFQINRSLDAAHAPNLRLDLGRAGLRGVNAIVIDGVGDLSLRVIGA